ncbi:MAG: Rne/Rng family ribonuclease [Fusobacteriota bacterium]
MKKLVVDKNDLETRIALLEEDSLTEYFFEHKEEKRLIGNIYIGRVANVLPGMEAAFIDIGLSKNAFLYIDDLREYETKYVDGIEKSKKSIEDIISIGDRIPVQILKEPRGTKGARVTTHFTIPGKYLVLMPNSDYIAISKKIKDEQEKERLETLLQDICPEDIGVIIRTAAKDIDKFKLIKEVEYLIKKWKKVEEEILVAPMGQIIYQETDMLERILRDLYSIKLDKLIVNSEKKYWELIDYISAFSDKDSKVKVKLYDGDTPIFEKYNIESELKEALSTKVWLDCGGYLIIEKTEALISIDVNTGKNIGESNLEETVVKTNIQAAKEIARQLRLRNLAGIIIIDFIDMKLEEDKEKLLEEFEKSLKNDRIRNKIVHFSELGLVEMTRKRVGKSLDRYFFEKCNHCNGTGRKQSMDITIMKMFEEITTLAKDTDISKLNLNAHPEVCQRINDNYLDYIKMYLNTKEKTINIQPQKMMAKKDINILLEK